MEKSPSEIDLSPSVIEMIDSICEQKLLESVSEQLLLLSELEFKKSFLVLSYIGRNKLEGAISVIDAKNILGLKDCPMSLFEMHIWNTYGKRYCDKSDRKMHHDWDSGKTHLYYCHVYLDGSCSFKGPVLETTRTHLQRALGDENVLIVKFEQEPKDISSYPPYVKIAEEGIFVCLRRFFFFVYKDGGKAEKKKSAASSGVKCYFVRMKSIAPRDQRETYILSNKTVQQARSLFMHLHTVPSMAKYASRFSLILSKTIKLHIDLDSVIVQKIEDILCYDNDSIVYNEDGEPLIQTDGTGFISEDLAMTCPKGFHNAKHIKDDDLEMELRGKKVCIREPPLLIQCRLFNKGCAVKGTLLLNKKLPKRTIQVRPSMIKVYADPMLENMPSLNSLEAVTISHRLRKKTTLSRNLIALLCYGGVPKDYFLSLLASALEDAKRTYSSKRAALKIAVNHGGIDDNFTSMRMILAGIPLNEQYLKHRLSYLSKEQHKGLKSGRIPISDSFYVMGTADPTGLLKRRQVCVIFENRHITGEVLVYRNPCLHFGDVHVLDAIPVKELNDYVGSAKYGIFFSTEGSRSIGNEFGNGDYDGDMYWVSSNPQLLKYFEPSEPWKRFHTTPKAVNRKPSEFTFKQLENEYFQLFLNARKQSNCMGVAAESWMALMDRLLILGDNCANEKEVVKESMLKLIDIYYDALDSSKSGKSVTVPDELKVEMLPHYMERENKYQSTSVLGLMYNMIQDFQAECLSVEENWKLPCFHAEIPDAIMNLWDQRYKEYRGEMQKAMSSNDESRKNSANEIIKKYKQILYGASELEESEKKLGDIYNEALAIYHVTYDYTKSIFGSEEDIKKCGFAWRVAGSALCQFHASNQSAGSISCLASVLRDILN